MAFTFSISNTDWMGSFEPVAVFASEVPNLPAPAAGKVYIKKKMVYTQWRYGKGLQGSSEIGTENTSGFSCTNGDDILTGGSGKKYRCTMDNPEPDPPGSGIWKHTQRWEYETDWALVDNDTV